MRKPENTVKFPEKIKRDSPILSGKKTREEAIAEVTAEAERRNVSPTALMATFDDGYVTGDGEVHSANGVTAEPRKEVRKSLPTISEGFETVEETVSE